MGKPTCGPYGLHMGKPAVRTLSQLTTDGSFWCIPGCRHWSCCRRWHWHRDCTLGCHHCSLWGWTPGSLILSSSSHLHHSSVGSHSSSWERRRDQYLFRFHRINVLRQYCQRFTRCIPLGPGRAQTGRSRSGDHRSTPVCDDSIGDGDGIYRCQVQHHHIII